MVDNGYELQLVQSLEVDVSEDSIILCFKKGQPHGAFALAQLTELNEPNLLDPFQIITDLDIEEANDAKILERSNNEDINFSKLC